MNSIYEPFISIGVTQTFVGLSQLMSSAAGNTNSIYERARITWSKLTVWLAPVSNADVSSLEAYLYPTNTPVEGITTPTALLAANQQYVRKGIALAGNTKPLKLVSAIPVRKFLGLTKETFGQDIYYCEHDNADPDQLLYWNLTIQKVGSGGIDDGTYALRYRLESLVEFDKPFDVELITPS